MRLIKGVNDLKTVNSEIAKDWDKEKNGELTPDNVHAYSNKYAYWICHKCGHKFKARIDSRTIACKIGCIQCINKKKSEDMKKRTFEEWKSIGLEQQIGEFLINDYPDMEKQKRFRDCRGLNFGILAYDFYIPSLNLLIEYNGEQHYNPISFKLRNRDEIILNYISQLEHDERKRRYAESNGYKLLSIPYTWKKKKNLGACITREINKICKEKMR